MRTRRHLLPLRSLLLALRSLLRGLRLHGLAPLEGLFRLLLASGLDLLLALHRLCLKGRTPRRSLLSPLRHQRGARVHRRPRGCGSIHDRPPEWLDRRPKFGWARGLGARGGRCRGGRCRGSRWRRGP